MREDEFKRLEAYGRVINDHFGGISPLTNYFIEYMDNKSDHPYLVKFTTKATNDPEVGYLGAKYGPLGISPKGEGGGGAIGLGKTGTKLAAKPSKEVNKALRIIPEGERATSGIFNASLRDKHITYESNKTQCT
jgi:hypothetical protein